MGIDISESYRRYFPSDKTTYVVFAIDYWCPFQVPYAYCDDIAPSGCDGLADIWIHVLIPDWMSDVDKELTVYAIRE